MERIWRGVPVQLDDVHAMEGIGDRISRIMGSIHQYSGLPQKITGVRGRSGG